VKDFRRRCSYSTPFYYLTVIKERSMTDQGPCPFLYPFICVIGVKIKKPGNDLLSHRVASAVPSAL
jgi:hypothetical protein